MPNSHQHADALGNVIIERAKAVGFGDTTYAASDALAKATRIPAVVLFSALAAEAELDYDQLETIAEHLGTDAETLIREAEAHASTPDRVCKPWCDSASGHAKDAPAERICLSASQTVYLARHVYLHDGGVGQEHIAANLKAPQRGTETVIELEFPGGVVNLTVQETQYLASGLNRLIQASGESGDRR